MHDINEHSQTPSERPLRRIKFGEIALLRRLRPQPIDIRSPPHQSEDRTQEQAAPRSGKRPMRSMREHAAYGAVRQQLACNPAESPLAQSAMAVAAGHNQIGSPP